MSEKLDGVRCFWDGSALRTRAWRAIAAPAWFTARLPRGTALDGELWGGYGTFQLTSELSRYARADDPAWRQMQLCVFDWPTCEALPVERRFLLARAAAEAAGCGWCEQRRIRTDEVPAELARVLARGGEGLMLRKPGHRYEYGRSHAWLKVKPAHID